MNIYLLNVTGTNSILKDNQIKSAIQMVCDECSSCGDQPGQSQSAPSVRFRNR